MRRMVMRGLFPRFHRLLVFLLFVPVFLLSACHRPEPPLRVGTNDWIGYEPLYLARALGHYEGTPVRLVEMNNTTEVIAALRAGRIDVAATTLDEALSLRQTGMDVRVILLIDASHGADAVLARPEIEHLAALAGRRIGVEQTAVGAVMLASTLAAAGLNAADVEIVPLTIDRHYAAFQAGEIDAVVTFDPVRTRLLKEGARLIYDSRAVPNLIVDLLVVPSTIAEKRGAALKTLIKGYFAALQHLQTYPEDAAHHMRIRQRLPPEEILASLQGLHLHTLAENHALLAGKPALLIKDAHRVGRAMIDYGLLPPNADLARLTADLTDPRWLPSLP